MAKYIIGLILIVPAGAYCLFTAMFFGWATATPLSPESLSRAKLYANLWGVGFFFFLILFMICIGRIAYLIDKKKKESKTTNE